MPRPRAPGFARAHRRSCRTPPRERRGSCRRSWTSSSRGVGDFSRRLSWMYRVRCARPVCATPQKCAGLRQHLERWKRADQSARGKGSEWVEPPRRGLLSRAWADRTRGSGSFETESVKSIRTRGIRRRTFFLPLDRLLTLREERNKKGVRVVHRPRPAGELSRLAVPHCPSDASPTNATRVPK